MNGIPQALPEDLEIQGNLLRHAWLASVGGSRRAQPVLVASLMRERGPTGLQTHVRAFRAAMRESGQDAALCTPWHAPWWQSGAAWIGRRLVRMASSAVEVGWHRSTHQMLLTRALKSTLARHRGGCVVYAQCPVAALAALSARKTCRQAVVMAVHFNISQADEWLGKGLIGAGSKQYNRIRKQEENVMPRLDGLVFVSEFMRNEVLERIPEAEQIPSVVLPNFVPDPGPCPQATPEADLISIGSLEPRKNHLYLLDIVAAARDMGTPLKLTLAGDGPQRAALQARVRMLGLDSQVRFAGYVEDAARLLRRHRAYIHTADMENMPLTLIEALAYSRPVFAPPVGGIPEIFRDGQEGRFLPKSNPVEAATLVLDWLRQPARLAVANLAARERFLENFESSVVATRLAGFLQSVAVH